MNHADTRAYCQTLGGDQITLHDQETADTVRGVLEQCMNWQQSCISCFTVLIILFILVHQQFGASFDIFFFANLWNGDTSSCADYQCNGSQWRVRGKSGAYEMQTFAFDPEIVDNIQISSGYACSNIVLFSTETTKLIDFHCLSVRWPLCMIPV